MVGKEQGGGTHIVGAILDECVAARFTLHNAGFVEEKVEVGDFAELGEDLEERIPGERRSYGERERMGWRAYSSTDGWRLPT